LVVQVISESGPVPQPTRYGHARLWVPIIVSPHATWEYSCRRPPSRELGGACYGDSGGPNFITLDGKLVLAGTTITGDIPCYATNVVYRTDSDSARDFLQQFVALP
jgi:hypothetical protein